MDIGDIDKALDMRLILTYLGSYPISRFSRTKGMSFQAGVIFGKENMEISCFIPEELEDNREVSIFLAQNKVKKHKKNFILNFTFDNQEVYNALHSTVDGLKSMVLDNLIMSNGTYYVSFRFSSRELTNVSNIVMRYAPLVEEVGVDYLGDNPGIENVMSEISEFTPLIRFEFSFEPPEKMPADNIIHALGNEWVTEARFMSSSPIFSQLIRTREKISNPEKYGIYKVDEDQNLYETEMDIPIMNSYFLKSYDFRMLRFQRSMHYKEGKFKVGVTVPDILSSDYLRILSDTSNEFPDWNLTITKVSKIRAKVQDEVP